LIQNFYFNIFFPFYKQSEEIPASLFVGKWFLTLFSCLLPVSTTLRIWDIFLIEGWTGPIRVGLAILENSKNFLLSEENSGQSDVLVYFDNLNGDVIECENLIEISLKFPLEPFCFEFGDE
jgi:hypothetical protein